MKSSLLLILLLLFDSCHQEDSTIMGEWQVISAYYNATICIEKKDESLQGRVLYYNDGTTILREDIDNPTYIFKNVRKDGNQYIDTLSGATQTTNKIETSIVIKHIDTLHLTRYVLQKPVQEKWIRILNN